MRVLIGCEFSGRVRDAFLDKGHDAISCDLLPTDVPGPHYQGDIFDIIDDGFDLAIFHPPCTYLTVSGNKWFKPEFADRFPTRHQDREDAIEFIMKLANCDIPKIAIENPVGVLSTRWRKPDQIIQPWMFGDAESKKTCLWLKNLPKLVPTNIVEPLYYKNEDGTDYRDSGGARYSVTHYLAGRGHGIYKNQTPSGQNKLGPSEDRAKIRSLTYLGIAAAMADQWS